MIFVRVCVCKLEKIVKELDKDEFLVCLFVVGVGKDI